LSRWNAWKPSQKPSTNVRGNVRGQALARYRDREIDVHDLDDALHRYSKAARSLWTFCWSTGSGSHVLVPGRALAGGCRGDDRRRLRAILFSGYRSG
jgi:hypothetical protein